LGTAAWVAEQRNRMALGLKCPNASEETARNRYNGIVIINRAAVVRMIVPALMDV
jgi:hypothetical protein